ncbi:hypothetical protein EV207_105130 [Scopulibacillus darangshiensis]|uniref:Membrane protein CcdC involved in cytochrome C biogenesis n=1 Tax=Scopulibacillus darangshiensis TaxID=442528 RepID=A0A4R2P964_9BACL|nr:hypothetical protein [Scopulibacillus darangshiensis]TCP30601.1 hypothetical protein EV207_105130 [Scopulibacillus darangshiensis]
MMHYIFGALILIVIIMNQLRERPMTGKLYRLPILLLISASYAVSKMPVVSVGDWVILSFGLFFAFGIGLIQGRYTHLTNRDGVWYVAGSTLAILVWIVSIPIKYGLSFVELSGLHLHPHLSGPSSYIIYLFSISGLLLGKVTMLMLRHPTLVKKMGKNEQKLRQLRAAR